MSACNAKAANPGVEVVSPKEFEAMLGEDGGAYLLDVRSPEEFEAGHLAGAHLLNWLDQDGFRRGAEGLEKCKAIYVYCRSGRRSGEAALYLAERGYRVVDMDGGILAWTGEGLPVSAGD